MQCPKEKALPQLLADKHTGDMPELWSQDQGSNPECSDYSWCESG